MPDGSDEPTDVRVVAVTAEDVVTALEHNRRSGGDSVLRLTPPFSGRMRARLHVRRGKDDPETVHVEPADLVETIPPYPDPADTEDAIRADPDLEYATELHRERHSAAVDEWREAVRAEIRDVVRLPTPSGPHRVEVTVLG